MKYRITYTTSYEVDAETEDAAHLAVKLSRRRDEVVYGRPAAEDEVLYVSSEREVVEVRDETAEYYAEKQSMTEQSYREG